jgi:hypothetical protein
MWSMRCWAAQLGAERTIQGQCHHFISYRVVWIPLKDPMKKQPATKRRWAGLECDVSAMLAPPRGDNLGLRASCEASQVYTFIDI